MTDEKPSIRKLALASIGKLTELLNEVLYVGKPDQWEKYGEYSGIIIKI